MYQLKHSQILSQAVSLLLLICSTLVFYGFFYGVSYGISYGASYGQSQHQQTVMVLGDSLSSGFKIDEGKNWVSLLQQCINNMHEDVLIVNESSNAKTTASGAAHLAESLEAYQPDVLIIVLGSNDQLQQINKHQISDNLAKMIQMSQQNDTKVILVGSPLQNSEQQQLFKTIATKNNVPLINHLYMELDQNPELFIDDLHANTLAQQTIMNTIWKQLFPVLGL